MTEVTFSRFLHVRSRSRKHDTILGNDLNIFRTPAHFAYQAGKKLVSHNLVSKKACRNWANIIHSQLHAVAPKGIIRGSSSLFRSFLCGDAQRSTGRAGMSPTTAFFSHARSDGGCFVVAVECGAEVGTVTRPHGGGLWSCGHQGRRCRWRRRSHRRMAGEGAVREIRIGSRRISSIGGGDGRPQAPAVSARNRRSSVVSCPVRHEKPFVVGICAAGYQRSPKGRASTSKLHARRS